MAIKSSTTESQSKNSVISKHDTQNRLVNFIFQRKIAINTDKKPINKDRNEKVRKIKVGDPSSATTMNKLEIAMPHIMASKKEFKNSVARNKARRRISEAYIAVWKENIEQNKDLVNQIDGKNKPSFKIHAKIGVLDCDFETLKKAIENQIYRA